MVNLDNNFNELVQYNNDQLKLGLFSWKRDKDDKTESKLFKCKHCGTTFDDKEKLKKHNEKAHSGKGK